MIKGEMPVAEDLHCCSGPESLSRALAHGRQSRCIGAVLRHLDIAPSCSSMQSRAHEGRCLVSGGQPNVESQRKGLQRRGEPTHIVVAGACATGCVYRKQPRLTSVRGLAREPFAKALAAGGAGSRISDGAALPGGSSGSTVGVRSNLYRGLFSSRS